MTAAFISRRFILTAIAGICAAPTLAFAQGAPAARFRAIEIDVDPLRQKGDTITAEWLAQDLPSAMRASFAAYLVPGDRRAPVLRARIDGVTLGSPGAASGFGDPDGAMDYIEGAGIVGGRGGTVYPFFSTVHSRPSMPDATGAQGRQRIDNLALSFAHWLPGKMGL